MRQEALHESKRGIYVILNMTIEELIKMMDFLLQCSGRNGAETF